MKILRINLWSSPRNISTAFMYAFAQRSDATVVDEPLYAHYLDVSGVQHPGQEAILASQNADGNQVVQDVLLGPSTTPVLFFKQMTHHLIKLDDRFLKQMANIMLIRDPRAIINSYAKVRPYPNMQDVGVQQQFELFQKLQAWGRLTAIIETSILLQDPKHILQKLCDRLDIPFQESMLSWPAGARPEDGVWAPYWYHNVHRSTGFKPYVPRSVELPPHLEELAVQCQPYYETLLNHVLK